MQEKHKVFILHYARTSYQHNQQNNPDFTWDDALTEAFEELDSGWGVFIDPTHEEYDELRQADPNAALVGYPDMTM